MPIPPGGNNYFKEDFKAIKHLHCKPRLQNRVPKNLYLKTLYLLNVKTTKIKEKIELKERMYNNFLDKKLNKFYSRQNNNVEKHRILMENFLFLVR